MKSRKLNAGVMRVEFDPINKKETEEAKSIFAQAKLEHRSIVSPDEKRQIQTWAGVRNGFIIKEIALADNSFYLRILDETGDRRLVWDWRDPRETSEAAKRFEEYLAKGWKAYAVMRDGHRGHRIMSFDPASQEVIFEEGNKREKIAEFAKKIAEVRMVPKTRPG